MDAVVGVDEVGRGALAGPVVIAAVLMSKNIHFKTLKDSKKLTARQREEWYSQFMTHPQISFAVTRVYPRGIERLNISQAANLAAKRAVKKILKTGAKRVSVPIFLDGGLYLGNKKWQRKNSSANTLVKADETVNAVMVASIIAKVHRDRFMKKLAKKYPAYGFDVHKGYGTKYHREMLEQNGPSSIHRLTFLRKTATI